MQRVSEHLDMLSISPHSPGTQLFRDLRSEPGIGAHGFHSSGGTDAAGSINILDNNILSTNSDLSGEQYGVIAGYMDVRHLVISGNTISNTYDNSILVELQMGATDITGNTLNGAFPSIFFMTYDGHDVSQPQVVSGNTIDMSSAEIGSGAAGIAFNPSTHFVTVDRRTGKYSSVEDFQ